MKRIWLYFIIVGILVQCPARAERWGVSSSNASGPESGSIVNSVYTNEFLGFSFPIPEGWQVYGDNIGSNGEVKAEVSPGGGLILLVIDHHTGEPIFSRIVMSALEGKSILADTQGFVSKFVRDQLSREGMSLVRDAFPVDFAGRHFFREDYKESSSGGTVYKAFICTKFRGYFLGWTFATGSPSDLEQSVTSLRRIEFGNEPDSIPEAAGLPGTIPGSQSTSMVGGVLGSVSRPSAPGRPLRVRVSQGVSQGMLVKKVQPQYPEDARHDRIQGQVVLQVIINTSGDIESATLVSGHPSLAPAAIEAVKQWKYKPYLLDGRPVKVETQIVVNFELSWH